MTETGTVPGVDQSNSSTPGSHKPTPTPRNIPKGKQGSSNTQVNSDEEEDGSHCAKGPHAYRPPQRGNARKLAKHFAEVAEKADDPPARPPGKGTLESGRLPQCQPNVSRSIENETKKKSAPLFEAPQCLLWSDKKGKFHFNPDVLNQVAALDKLLVVVAVTGLYRTGKSYLLNRLAGNNSGFSLGYTVQSTTKGIWIWAKEHPLNSDRYLVLLDTEGLGDVKRGDKVHDNWIFALATLLSSVLVYNAMGAINEEAIAKLSFIPDMSKHIRTTSDAKDDHPDENFDWYFPTIIFIIRDFNLHLEIDGREITEDEYLEDCLTLRPEKTETDVRYNKPRKCIRRYFGRRKCFTFDRPTAERQKLQRLEQLEDSDLMANFVQETKNFCSFVYQKGEIKKIGEGRPLSGRMWATLVKNYVESIQRCTRPCIENAICAIGDTENELAMKAALQVYTDQMEKVDLPTPDDDTLTEIHYRAHSAAVKCFVKREIYDTGNEYFKKLNESIRSASEAILAENDKASRVKSRKMLEVLEQDMAKKIHNGAYMRSGGHKEYNEDRLKMQSLYMNTPGLGSQSNAVLVEYLLEQSEQEKKIIEADRAITEQQRNEEAEHQKKLCLRKEKHTTEQHKRTTALIEYNKEKAHKLCVKEMEERNAEKKKALNTHLEEITRERMLEHERLQREGFNEDATVLAQTIEKSKEETKKVNSRACIIL